MPNINHRRSRHSFVELIAMSNFSFQEGASHPEEIINSASELGLAAIAITDRNSLAGIVRAHTAAKHAGIPFLIGALLDLTIDTSLTTDTTTNTTTKAAIKNPTRGTIPTKAPPQRKITIAIYPKCRGSYATLSRLLSKGKLRSVKGEFSLYLSEFLPFAAQFLLAVPPFSRESIALLASSSPWNALELIILELLSHDVAPTNLGICLHRGYNAHDNKCIGQLKKLCDRYSLPPIATANVRYHTPYRKQLHDVLTCIKHKTTISKAGFLLTPNAQYSLVHPNEMYRLFRDIPESLATGLHFAESASNFSLEELTYDYPVPSCPSDLTPYEYLQHLVYQGANRRYPQGLPDRVATLLEQELLLIKELRYEKYFLTCADIVTWARSREILCQGRGAAANSAVCFCLGITAVDPTKIDLLFGRFISKERNEPPDIDIDFEHERREEVIQYIYQRYGREYAALTGAVITFRHRSAVRDVGKALGLPERVVDSLAKSIHRWTEAKIPDEEFAQQGIDPSAPLIQDLLRLSTELKGFPRHLTQHVGGFIISATPLTEIVPVLNAGMESRTIIEWDKDDIETLGILKIDVLALGMLTCIRKCLTTINERRRHQGEIPLTLATIPTEDQATYDMLCRADSIGVFQVESRAQMSMLPRLKPRTFYDLVIQVAIVRPGPIQGDMVHPYLRRRAGLEKIAFPDQRVANILGKTLGVPLFQEQAMRLAIVLANFTPGEAEQLRRAMAAWKRHDGIISTFKERIIDGMVQSGYSVEFAETCMHQIKGFSEYGFPESHAASFALLVYASAWLKCHFPADFAAGLLNSQPMGFYAPSQIIADAQRHGVTVLPIDINRSRWDSTLTLSDTSSPSHPILQLGMTLVRHLGAPTAELIEETRILDGDFTGIEDIWLRTTKLNASRSNRANTHQINLQQVKPHQIKYGLLSLAKADAFTSISLAPREALWMIRALRSHLPQLNLTRPLQEHIQEEFDFLPKLSLREASFLDYSATGFSLKGHPIQYIRHHLNIKSAFTAQELQSCAHGTPAVIAGISLIRQRPGTARGVVFITLEDETGLANLVIRPSVFERFHRPIITSLSLLCIGKVERTGDVIYLNVSALESLDTHVFGSKAELKQSVETRNYSY